MGEGARRLSFAPFPSVKSYCIADLPEIRANVLSALERGLPEARWCETHDGTLSIAGGGPSLAKTCHAMQGKVGAVNKAGDFLIAQGVVPWAVSLLDPHPVLAETFTPDPRVVYFVASMCAPATFDKLKGHTVFVWHAASGPEGRRLLLDILGSDSSSVVIGGGSTVGLRWLNLGYVLGYRRFHLHGMDSSYTHNKHHAYEFAQDDVIRPFEFNGHPTSMGMLAQVTDFFAVMETFKAPGMEPCEVEVFGEGILPDEWRARQKGN